STSLSPCDGIAAMDDWFGLHIVGTRRPVPTEMLTRIEREENVAFPAAYKALLTTWGVGTLGAWIPMLEPGDQAWGLHRSFMRTDGRQSRREHGLWSGIDDETYAQLVTFADLDGKTLSFDGANTIWLLDRDGRIAIAVAQSLRELVEDFILGGGIDKL